ncbi:MAG: helix-turn-helix domain containing protein [Bacteroidales bacterium]|nr:helix-turn-helix domain containing protein [Bacteroidales bacterium]
MSRSENLQVKMFALIEELYQSNVNRKEFCRQHSISVNCFYYWQKKYRQQAQSDQPCFITVRTGKGSITRHGFSHPIVLSYPNGISLQLPAGTPMATIGSLFRLI